MTQHDPGPTEDAGRPSIGALVGSITEQAARLVRAEVAAAKSEVTGKLAKSGMGIGLLAGAAILALYGLGFLLWAAVTAIALALPMWAATLIVAVSLFLIAAILGVVGKKLVDKHKNPTPTVAIASIKADLASVKDSIK